ncbi:MAG: hypothetical protein PHF51_03640 [Candidatus ainarchaeum sp.]|nr:hypothetical protein [Candidatus ainarchaeum sp.]
MVLVAFDLRGTALVRDFDELKSYAPRAGFMPMLKKQRKLKWQSALMCEEEAATAEKSLLLSGIAGSFHHHYYKHDLDRARQKNFPALKKKDDWLVFVGDKPKDSAVAARHAVSAIRVPQFSHPKDKFDFSIVQELLEAIILRQFAEFRRENRLREIRSAKNFKELGGECFRLRVFPHRFEAHFTD